MRIIKIKDQHKVDKEKLALQQKIYKDRGKFENLLYWERTTAPDKKLKEVLIKQKLKRKEFNKKEKALKLVLANM